MKIFITGTPKSEKESILEIMIPRYSKILPKGEYMKLGKEGTPKKHDAGRKHMIVVGDIIEKTPHGYQVVNKEFLHTVKPDMTVVLHAETDNPEINEWQDMIKIYCLTNFSGRLKVISVNEGNVKDAIKELAYTLKNAFV